MTQHTNPRAPRYAPLSPGQRVTYVDAYGERCRGIVLQAFKDPWPSGGHCYMVETVAPLGNYRTVLSAVNLRRQ